MAEVQALVGAAAEDCASEKRRDRSRLHSYNASF